jgi:hypothetical protein
MANTTPAPAYTLPTIHPNGTGAQTLADEYEAFYVTLEAAGKALQRATCNGRDFYPQGPGAYERASMEREVAFSKLKDLQAYAEAWFDRASGLD